MLACQSVSAFVMSGPISITHCFREPGGDTDDARFHGVSEGVGVYNGRSPCFLLETRRSAASRRRSTSASASQSGRVDVPRSRSWINAHGERAHRRGFVSIYMTLVIPPILPIPRYHILECVTTADPIPTKLGRRRHVTCKIGHAKLLGQQVTWSGHSAHYTGSLWHASGA